MKAQSLSRCLSKGGLGTSSQVLRLELDKWCEKISFHPVQTGLKEEEPGLLPWCWGSLRLRFEFSGMCLCSVRVLAGESRCANVRTLTCVCISRAGESSVCVSSHVLLLPCASPWYPRNHGVSHKYRLQSEAQQHLKGERKDTQTELLTWA